MNSIADSYDVVIIGAGHNGLVAASYLGRAGRSVLVLERNASIGGATCSKRVFPGVDARLSVYSYLVSLFPEKIARDLGLNLRLLPRDTASYTPSWDGNILRELLVSNASPSRTRASFEGLAGGVEDYRGYLRLQEMQASLAKVLWPTLLEPLRTRKELVAALDREQRIAWEALVERPLGETIESHLSSDLVRGMVFTDAKIGVFTHPHDQTLLQNRTFLYHVIGQASVAFELDNCRHSVDTRFVLCNAAPSVLQQLMGTAPMPAQPEDEGSVVKINLLLKRLPKLKSESTQPKEAFCGTFHIDEGYDAMKVNYRNAIAGKVTERPAGEMYCHTLTDNSILSGELNAKGYHTLTLFGLDMPYAAFANDNDGLRDVVLQRYLEGINRYTAEPVEDCLAMDKNGQPCIEIKTPVDLEREIHLPRGNIFHNALTWPFVEEESDAGQWGVETGWPNILLCGSGARRGGAVSGIPGHNAAMKVLGELSGRPK